MANRFFINYAKDEENKIVGYKITSPYGMRALFGKKDMHNGIDLVAKNKVGSSVTAYITAHTGGTVYSTGYDVSAGNYVYIQVAKGVLMAYFHMKDGSVRVKKGQTVKTGEVIGYMGSTGNSTGAHLHWGIKVNGKWIDPTAYLDKNYLNEDKTELINSEFTDYTIKRGDTLGKIAKKYNTTVEYLAEINNIENVNLIITGNVIKVPVVKSESESKPVKSDYKVGDIIKLKEGATYWNGKEIPDWVFKKTLYYRGTNKNGVIFSTQKEGAITGVVKPENIK